jgi:DNA-binding beta-propeller fold protein YncE
MLLLTRGTGQAVITGMRVVFILLFFYAAALRADLFLSGFNTNAVYRYDEATGAPVGSGVFIAAGSGLNLPHGILRMADGSYIVASAGNDSILRYSSTGSSLGPFIANGVNGVPALTLDYPVDFALGGDGLLYVTSQLNDRVVRFNAATGAFVDVFISGGALSGPSGLAFGANGDLYVVGRFSNNVIRYDDASGSVVGAFAPAAFNQPFGIAVRPGDGVLFVANGSSNQIRSLDATTGATIGNITTGSLNLPIGLEFGPGGDLFAASFNNDKLARFDGVTGTYEGDFVSAGSAGVDGPNFFTFAVPEPSTAVCALLGVGAMGMVRRREY